MKIAKRMAESLKVIDRTKLYDVATGVEKV